MLQHATIYLIWILCNRHHFKSLAFKIYCSELEEQYHYSVPYCIKQHCIVVHY